MKRQIIALVMLVCWLVFLHAAIGSELELVWEFPASENIVYHGGIKGLDSRSNEIVFTTRHTGAGCGGGTPASAWKIILDPVTGDVQSIIKKQVLSKIQNDRGVVFESSDGLLFTGGGWCGVKPPYFSEDGGENWLAADRGTHPPNSTFSIGEFNGDIYAGTGYYPHKGELYRWLGDDGPNHWERVFVMQPPNGMVYSIVEYNNKLFIANADLHHWPGSCANSLPVYISYDGSTFSETEGIPTCYTASDLVVVDGELVAKVQDHQSGIWYMYHWDDAAETWEKIAPINLGNYNNRARMVSYHNLIFTYGHADNDPTPGIYQSNNMGNSWEQLASIDTTSWSFPHPVISMDAYNDALYLGTTADKEGKTYIYRILLESDKDDDGVDDASDNCPETPNPNQADYDDDSLGDACDDDIDGDGVVKDDDACPFTELDIIVDAAGCSINQLCPCEGPRGVTSLWKNHGKFASCTAKSAESFVEASLITDAEKDAIVSDAAQSDCGDKK